MLAGLGRYDRRRDPVDHVLDPCLPAEPGRAHAVLRRFKPREPEFYETPSYYLTALCGAAVKVVLPLTFDPGDPDACQSCASHMHNGTRSTRSWDAALWEDHDESAVS